MCRSLKKFSNTFFPRGPAFYHNASLLLVANLNMQPTHTTPPTVANQNFDLHLSSLLDCFLPLFLLFVLIISLSFSLQSSVLFLVLMLRFSGSFFREASLPTSCWEMVPGLTIQALYTEPEPGF